MDAINRYGWTSSIGIGGRRHSVRPYCGERLVVVRAGGSEIELLRYMPRKTMIAPLTASGAHLQISTIRAGSSGKLEFGWRGWSRTADFFSGG